jgi:cytochrome c1
MVDYKEDVTMNKNNNFNHDNLDIEDRLQLSADNMGAKIPESYYEMLHGYYPDLNQKEMAVCLATCYVISDLNGYTNYDAIVEYSMNDGGRELFVDEKTVEDTIKQLIEKGILKIEYSYTVNKISRICKSRLCLRAFYHLVKLCDFVKEEIGVEALNF